MSTLVGISGSLRASSCNTYLIRNAAEIYGVDTFIEANINFPLFNEDLEASDGIPAAVQKLADQIAAADAVIISTPEYNKSISGVLKNALDWISRTEGNCWGNKPLAIMSATAGRAGGERTQFALRHCMMPFRPRILQGPEVLVGQCSAQFDDSGKLAAENYRKFLTDLMDELRAIS